MASRVYPPLPVVMADSGSGTDIAAAVDTAFPDPQLGQIMVLGWAGSSSKELRVYMNPSGIDFYNKWKYVAGT